MSDRDDFRQLLDGDIDSAEYVRRLRERVRLANEQAPIGGRYHADPRKVRRALEVRDAIRDARPKRRLSWPPWQRPPASR